MTYYCERCDRHFNARYALQQHEDHSSSHHICHDCNRDYRTRQELESHWERSSVHSYCISCDEHFDDDDELTDHFEVKHWYCSACRKLFESGKALHNHDLEEHSYYCSSCQRHFQNQHNLDTHLRSSIHKPSKYKCPAVQCQQTFISIPALVMHCESGSCRSGVTKQAINLLVHAIDQGNTLTNPNRLIGYHDTPEALTRYFATPDSWNGYAYECFICHKEFRTLHALNAHIDSPAHQEDIYRCPVQSNGCSDEFRTLSGLFQHVESGCCDVRKFHRQMVSGFMGGLAPSPPLAPPIHRAVPVYEYAYPGPPPGYMYPPMGGRYLTY